MKALRPQSYKEDKAEIVERTKEEQEPRSTSSEDQLGMVEQGSQVSDVDDERADSSEEISNKKQDSKRTVIVSIFGQDVAEHEMHRPPYSRGRNKEAA